MHGNARRGGARRRWKVLRRPLRALLGGLALLIAFALDRPTAQANGELRFITSGNYPPFVYTDANGALAGFEIDLANAVCATLARRCQFVDLPFEQIIPALIAGQGDAIVASL